MTQYQLHQPPPPHSRPSRPRRPVHPACSPSRTYLPTPAQIAAECAAIRAGWAIPGVHRTGAMICRPGVAKLAEQGLTTGRAAKVVNNKVVFEEG